MALARPNPVAKAPAPSDAREAVLTPLDLATPRASPVFEQMQRIEQAFADRPPAEEPRYPGFVRLGIIIGGSAGLWAFLLLGAARLIRP